MSHPKRGFATRRSTLYPERFKPNSRNQEKLQQSSKNIFANLLTFSLPILTFTLSWNGVSDSISNYSYLCLITIFLILFSAYGKKYKIAFINPLILGILISTTITVILGQQKLVYLNDLRAKFFSSTKFLGETPTIYDPLMDLIPAIKWIFALVSLPYIVQILKIQFPRILIYSTYAWIFGVVVNILAQILQYTKILHINTESFDPQNYTGTRFPGLSTHPNALAISVCLTLPLCFLNYIGIPKFLKPLLVSIFFASILITGSRAGIIVFICGIILIISKKEDANGLRLNYVFILIFFLIIIFLSEVYNILLSNTRLNSSDVSAQISNAARISLLKFGWNAFLDYPFFGVGASIIKTSHNIYLQIMSSFGFFVFFAYLSSIKRMLRNSDQISWIEKLPLVMFLIFGFLNNSLSDFYLYFPLGFAYSLKFASHGRSYN